MNSDPEQAMQAIAHARQCELVTALQSKYALMLGRYDEVLQITQQTSNPAETPFEALALIHRGSAIRETGNPAESLKVISGATLGAAGKPDVMNRLNFETGRCYAALGHVTAARNTYILLRWSDPNFPELDEAIGALPAARTAHQNRTLNQDVRQ
jgi:hypothetical protein